MTISLPNLDDRTYADLVDEMRSLIPTECPTWTDHNPSDTGIILLELFAWLTEMTLYRVDQIPDQNWGAMLSLLGGELPSSTQPLTDQALQKSFQATLLNLRQRYRAVTPTDFEQLTLHDWHQSDSADALGAQGQVQRVQCLPQVNLAAAPGSRARELAPGHISLVILPKKPSSETEPAVKQPGDPLRHGLWNFLDQRRLLTTQLHILGPEYVEVAIHTTLRLQEGMMAVDLRPVVTNAVTTFFDPWTGGKQGQGWPFGRNVYESDIYELLDGIPGVDYVDELTLSTVGVSDPGSETTNGEATLTSIAIMSHQLPDVSTVRLTLKESWEK